MSNPSNEEEENFEEIAREEETPPLSPEEVALIRAGKPLPSSKEEDILAVRNAKLEKLAEQSEDSNATSDETLLAEAIQNAKNSPTGGMGALRIDLESQGRFSLPETLYFDAYTFEDVNQLSLSNEDDLLANLVEVLRRRQVGTNVDIREATLEEFLSILADMKAQYNTEKHPHFWFCDCQDHLPDNQRNYSQKEINLKTLKRRTIMEVEEILRGDMKKRFEAMGEEAWKSYLEMKYPNGIPEDATRETEIKKVRYKEPIKFKGLNGKVYEFRLTRVKDLIFGFNVANRQYAHKIRRARNAYKPNVSKEELQEWRNNEVKALESERAKKALIYTRAESLVSVNGKVLKNEDERIAEMQSVDSQSVIEYSKYLKYLNFGIHDERQLDCNLCGKPERGYLHQRISPLELLPIDASEADGSAPGYKNNAGLDFFFAS